MLAKVAGKVLGKVAGKDFKTSKFASEIPALERRANKAAPMPDRISKRFSSSWSSPSSERTNE